MLSDDHEFGYGSYVISEELILDDHMMGIFIIKTNQICSLQSKKANVLLIFMHTADHRK